MLRGSHAFGLVLLLTACGGDSGGPSAPTPLYPAVAGNYSLSGTFDDFPESFARVTGTFSIQQASTATGTLTGTSRLTWWVDGESALYDFPLSSASVTTTGTLTFTFVDDVGDSWTFTGQVASGTVTGRHSLDIGEVGGDLTGDFTATRTGGAVTGAVMPAGPSNRFNAPLGRTSSRLLDLTSSTGASATHRAAE